MSKDTITVNMNVNDIPIVVEALKKANKEIERLNNKIHDISETLNETYNDRTELRNENKRLNNIINELEKDVKERIVFKEQEIKEFRGDLFTSNYEEIEVAKNEINIRKYEITELKDTLDKIEELKGSDKDA